MIVVSSPQAELAQVALSLCRACEFIEERQLVHRAIMARNVSEWSSTLQVNLRLLLFQSYDVQNKQQPKPISGIRYLYPQRAERKHHVALSKTCSSYSTR